MSRSKCQSTMFAKPILTLLSICFRPVDCQLPTETQFLGLLFLRILIFDFYRVLKSKVTNVRSVSIQCMDKSSVQTRERRLESDCVCYCCLTTGGLTAQVRWLGLRVGAAA